jgi:hypothetical protein
MLAGKAEEHLKLSNEARKRVKVARAVTRQTYCVYCVAQAHLWGHVLHIVKMQ